MALLLYRIVNCLQYNSWVVNYDRKAFIRLTVEDFCNVVVVVVVVVVDFIRRQKFLQIYKI